MLNDYFAEVSAPRCEDACRARVHVEGDARVRVENRPRQFFTEKNARKAPRKGLGNFLRKNEEFVAELLEQLGEIAKAERPG